MSRPRVGRRRPSEAARRRVRHFSHSVACEIIKFAAGIQHDYVLSFGDQDAACRLDLVHWTRGGRGLHFDVLLREVANVGTCRPSAVPTPTQDAAHMSVNTDLTRLGDIRLHDANAQHPAATC